MSLNTDDPRAPYLQVTDSLRREIASGELKPGQRLPSIRELAARFGVSAMTIQSALRELRGLELVTTQQGRGAYVRSDAPAIAARAEAEQVEPTDYRAIREQLRTMSATVRDLAGRVEALESEVRSAKH